MRDCSNSPRGKFCAVEVLAQRQGPILTVVSCKDLRGAACMCSFSCRVCAFTICALCVLGLQRLLDRLEEGDAQVISAHIRGDAGYQAKTTHFLVCGARLRPLACGGVLLLALLRIKCTQFFSSVALASLMGVYCAEPHHHSLPHYRKTMTRSVQLPSLRYSWRLVRDPELLSHMLRQV